MELLFWNLFYFLLKLQNKTTAEQIHFYIHVSDVRKDMQEQNAETFCKEMMRTR